MSKWIDFELLTPPDDIIYKPKTKRWAVQRKAPDWTQLGIIKWACGWRKYAFYPYKDTLFEQDCLQDIANFMEKQMKLRRK